MNYPIPNNEKERIAALLKLRILDTEDDPVFDTIAKLAASIIGTPAALITFMDTDRGFVKARVGFTAREGSREHGFCTHTIVDPSGSMLVKDSLLDERFANNPWVIGEPKIRFYFGVSLVTAKKEAIGTICVTDSVPRPAPTEKQFQEIEYLAKLIMHNLELRDHIFDFYDEFQKIKEVSLYESKFVIADVYKILDEKCALTLEKIKARKQKP